MAGRPKGLPKTGGGNRRGIPNKTTKALKDMILGALEGVGGEKYLMEQAKENPGPFMALVGKVLPSTLNVSGADGGPIQHSFNFTVIKAADADQD
ncbi:MAG: hypothetical protein HGA87_01400 [Desulfobulbaceae bacterium]|nr:hypothetical protein [Desulfobulbaceae bacterium]